MFKAKSERFDAVFLDYSNLLKTYQEFAEYGKTPQLIKQLLRKSGRANKSSTVSEGIDP